MNSVELYRLPEGRWAAHCPEAGMGAQAATRAQAVTLLNQALQRSGRETDKNLPRGVDSSRRAPNALSEKNPAKEQKAIFDLPRPGHASWNAAPFFKKELI